jgi:hypothetical protein
MAMVPRGVAANRRKVAAYRVIIACLLMASFGRPPLANAAACRFVLGFAALHGLVPGVVGACLEDEQHNPLTGDGMQHTTRGLLVWRKADNRTAFTDGYRTWVLGPFGMQQRLNAQRFPWEANPAGLPVVGPAPPALQMPGRCHTAELALTQEHGQVAVGNVGVTFRLRSLAAQVCTLYGFPGVQLLDAAARPMPTYLTWSRSGYLIGAVPEQTLTLDPGSSVYFVLEYTDVAGPNQACRAAPSLRVTPPNAYTSIVTAVHGIAPCGGVIRASPVLATDPLAAGGR